MNPFTERFLKRHPDVNPGMWNVLDSITYQLWLADMDESFRKATGWDVALRHTAEYKDALIKYIDDTYA